MTHTEIVGINNSLFNMIQNQNNLKQLVKLGGLRHAEVAEKKGIAPESLSSDISSKSRLSI